MINRVINLRSCGRSEWLRRGRRWVDVDATCAVDGRSSARDDWWARLYVHSVSVWSRHSAAETGRRTSDRGTSSAAPLPCQLRRGSHSIGSSTSSSSHRWLDVFGTQPASTSTSTVSSRRRARLAYAWVYFRFRSRDLSVRRFLCLVFVFFFDLPSINLRCNLYVYSL